MSNMIRDNIIKIKPKTINGREIKDETKKINIIFRCFYGEGIYYSLTRDAKNIPLKFHMLHIVHETKVEKNKSLKIKGYSLSKVYKELGGKENLVFIDLKIDKNSQIHLQPVIHLGIVKALKLIQSNNFEELDKIATKIKNRHLLIKEPDEETMNKSNYSQKDFTEEYQLKIEDQKLFNIQSKNRSRRAQRRVERMIPENELINIADQFKNQYSFPPNPVLNLR